MNVFDFMEGFAFCMIRPGVALSLLPFGTNGPLGKAIRLPLVLVFATLPAHESVPRNLLHAAAAEVFIGLAIGLLLGVVFHVASTAGALLDQQSGYTIASVYDPSFGEEAALMQTLFTQFAALTFFTGDGLKAVIGLFADSWALWPPGLDHGGAEHLFQTFSAERLASSFAEGLRIAAPLVVLLILVDISFGLMSRHAKRLNPFATARPVKVMVLSLAAASAVPVVFEHLLRIVVAGARLE